MLERLDCALADHQPDDLAQEVSAAGRVATRPSRSTVMRSAIRRISQPVADVEDGRSRVAEAPEMSEGQRDLHSQ
jgi:hypothetical protein